MLQGVLDAHKHYWSIKYYVLIREVSAGVYAGFHPQNNIQIKSLLPIGALDTKLSIFLTVTINMKQVLISCDSVM